MKEEIEALRKELANITESFNQRINSLEKTTLEVGKWYELNDIITEYREKIKAIKNAA